MRTLATILAFLSLVAAASGQYYTHEEGIDPQSPDADAVLGPFLTGNNIYLKLPVYEADTANTNLGDWTFTFYFGPGQYDTSGMSTVSGTVASNIISFVSTSQLNKADAWYWSCVGVHTNGNKKTWGRGRMDVDYDPAAGNPPALSLLVPIDFTSYTFTSGDTGGPFLAGSNTTFRASGSRGTYYIDVTGTAGLGVLTNATVFGGDATGIWSSLVVTSIGGVAVADYTQDSEWDTMAEINAASTDTDAVLDTDIGATVQAYDADLDDLADGSLTGTKVADVVLLDGSRAWTGDHNAGGYSLTNVATNSIEFVGGYALGTDAAGVLLWRNAAVVTNGATFNASGATNLTGTEIRSGTVADARIAATIARDSEVTTATSGVWQASQYPLAALATVVNTQVWSAAQVVNYAESDPVAATSVWGNAQYPNALLTDGTRAMAGDLDFGGQLGTNYGTPTAADHVIDKGFADGAYLAVTNQMAGFISGFYAYYTTTTAIAITPGRGYCNGHYFETNALFTYSMASLAAGEDYHYIYIDDDASTYPRPTLIDSTNEPAWDGDRDGFYNGDDRCISAFWSQAASATLMIVAVQVNGGPYRFHTGANDANSIKRIASDMNPDGTVNQTPDDAESSAYLPVTANEVRLHMTGGDSGATAMVFAQPKEGAATVQNSAGWVRHAAWDVVFNSWWIGLGPSRDVRIGGQGTDDNVLNAYVRGYGIRR